MRANFRRVLTHSLPLRAVLPILISKKYTEGVLSFELNDGYHTKVKVSTMSSNLSRFIKLPTVHCGPTLIHTPTAASYRS